MLAALYILIRMAIYFATTTGTVWERLLATGKYSATVVWSMIVILGSTILTGVGYLGDALNLPEVKDWSTRLPAEWVGASVAVIMAITVISRMRTLPSRTTE
jgi:hypothetical protein